MMFKNHGIFFELFQSYNKQILKIFDLLRNNNK